MYINGNSMISSLLVNNLLGCLKSLDRSSVKVIRNQPYYNESVETPKCFVLRQMGSLFSSFVFLRFSETQNCWDTSAKNRIVMKKILVDIK